MRVQEGKKYKMRNGVIVGPMVRYGMYLVHGDTSFLYLEEDVITADGVLFEGWRVHCGVDDPEDLIEEIEE